MDRAPIEDDDRYTDPDDYQTQEDREEAIAAAERAEEWADMLDWQRSLGARN